MPAGQVGNGLVVVGMDRVIGSGVMNNFALTVILCYASHFCPVSLGSICLFKVPHSLSLSLFLLLLLSVQFRNFNHPTRGSFVVVIAGSSLFLLLSFLKNVLGLAGSYG